MDVPRRSGGQRVLRPWPGLTRSLNDTPTREHKLLDTEGPEKVNPASPRDQQFANIRRIYGPEKEALGVLAIEIRVFVRTVCPSAK